jgi:hypothetical protein
MQGQAIVFGQHLLPWFHWLAILDPTVDLRILAIRYGIRFGQILLGQNILPPIPGTYDVVNASRVFNSN